MSAPACRAIGCRALVLPTELFCARHVRLCPSDIKRILDRKFRPGRAPSKVFSSTLSLALKEILYWQTEGHPTPRDRAFEFDDDGKAETDAR